MRNLEPDLFLGRKGDLVLRAAALVKHGMSLKSLGQRTLQRPRTAKRFFQQDSRFRVCEEK